MFISDSNGNSFRFGGNSGGGGGMIGPACFSGEGIVIEDWPSRMLASFQGSAFI